MHRDLHLFSLHFTPAFEEHRVECRLQESDSFHDGDSNPRPTTVMQSGEKPELQRRLERRRQEQYRELELAKHQPSDLEQELRKRQLKLREHEEEEVKRRSDQDNVPEFVRVKEKLRHIESSGQVGPSGILKLWCGIVVKDFAKSLQSAFQRIAVLKALEGQGGGEDLRSLNGPWITGDERS
ncbi:hypothetical protein GJAV_G00192680 [Gymnothorax javanicus]|nr:hypothetical protein GJAV_G00192680 [Gymnothorax javanicus]